MASYYGYCLLRNSKSSLKSVKRLAQPGDNYGSSYPIAKEMKYESVYKVSGEIVNREGTTIASNSIGCRRIGGNTKRWFRDER